MYCLFSTITPQFLNALIQLSTLFIWLTKGVFLSCYCKYVYAIINHKRPGRACQRRLSRLDSTIALKFLNTFMYLSFYVSMPPSICPSFYRQLLNTICGVVSGYNGKICTRSIKCPAHNDTQRRDVSTTRLKIPADAVHAADVIGLKTCMPYLNLLEEISVLKRS